jgi:fructan beta-fructosidase
VTFDLHGVSVTYDARRQLLICKQHQAALKPVDGTIRLRVLVDRGSVEVFANGGRVAMSVGAVPDAAKREVALNVKGGEVRIESLVVHELRSAWR